MLDGELLRLYETETVEELFAAVTRILSRHVPTTFFLICFAPTTFREQMIVHPPNATNKQLVKLYIEKYYHDDIWLRNSPIHPKVRVVRHSDYTDLKTLKASVYYKKCLKPANSLHGCSPVAWHLEQWLGTITLHRSAKLGDFTDKDLTLLRELQPVFSRVVRRLSLDRQHQLRETSLHLFLQNMPTAFMLFDWSMRLLHFNHAARWKSMEMDHGLETNLKNPRQIEAPQEIVE